MVFQSLNLFSPYLQEAHLSFVDLHFLNACHAKIGDQQTCNGF